MSALVVAVGVLLAAAALLAVYRVVVGPSILDRMIASDVLLTTILIGIGAEMVHGSHTRNIPIMLVLATTAIFATVTVARYVAWRERTGGEDQ